MLSPSVIVAAICALTSVYSASAETVLATSDGGPGKSTLQLFKLGTTSKSSKALGSTTITPAKSGIPTVTAVAGDLAFTIGVTQPTSAAKTASEVGKTYITVTKINSSKTAVKVVGFSGVLADLHTGKLAGCPASLFGGSFTARKTGSDTYDLYFSADCLFKCRNKLGGADRGYIVQYKYNSKTGKFSGLQSNPYQYQSDPKCGGQVAIFAADIRYHSGEFYALLVDQLGLKQTKLVQLIGKGELKTIFSGSKCSGGGAVKSSESYYQVCRTSNGKGTGVVLYRKGSSPPAVLSGKYTSTQSLYGPQFGISNRLLTIRGPSNSHNPPLKQYIIAHSLSTMPSRIKSPWQPVILLPLATLSWFDVDTV